MQNLATIADFPEIENINFENSLSFIKKFVFDYSISQSKIAERIGMNKNTFKLKFNDNYPNYKFKPSEILLIIRFIKEISDKAKEISDNKVSEEVLSEL